MVSFETSSKIQGVKEGYVRATYGAVVAGSQVRAFQDEQVGAALDRIVADELRHAELTCSMDAWAAQNLTAAELKRAHHARLKAFYGQERLIEQEPPEAVLMGQAAPPSRDAAR